MMLDDAHKPADGGAAPSAGDSSQHAKRRSVRRCPLVATAEVKEPLSGARLSARTSEIGLGGCYIDTLNPLPQGMLVHVRILRDNGAFETNAKIVYSDGRYGMGLAFVDMTPEQRSMLETWLAELITQPRSAL